MGCQVCNSSSRRYYEDFCSNLELAALPEKSEFTKKINEFKDTIPIWLRSIEAMKEKNKINSIPSAESKKSFEEYDKQTKKVDSLINELYKLQQGKNVQETSKFKKQLDEAEKLVKKIKEEEDRSVDENNKENLLSIQSKIKKIKETSF